MLCRQPRFDPNAGLVNRRLNSKHDFINRKAKGDTKLNWKELKLTHKAAWGNAHNTEGRRDTEQRESLT